jgi:transcription initiation factor IIE alpha subunit
MKEVKAKDVQTKSDHLPQCIVCSEKSEQGMYIWSQFICKQCEGEMVETEVCDEKYSFFVKQMKKIWLKENA